MSGVLAFWCRSVRPGMIAHAIVETLNAGSVIVSDEPLAGTCCTSMGWIGFCPCVDAAVIWYTEAVPESTAPLIAVACGEVKRLMATNTIRPGLVLSELA